MASDIEKQAVQGLILERMETLEESPTFTSDVCFGPVKNYYTWDWNSRV